MDSAIHRINHYPEDKYYENQLRYPLDSNLSGGWRYPPFEQLGPDHIGVGVKITVFIIETRVFKWKIDHALYS